MAKLARFVIRGSSMSMDIPIDEGNTFCNLILQCRQQGFVLDQRANAYVPMGDVHYAFQIETDIGTVGMTKQ
jgi:hypothetical protein